MTFYEAKEHIGRKVRHEGEEYVLLQVWRRKKELLPGVPNPFMQYEFDGMLFHPERSAARIVPIEQIEALPRDPFRRRLQFGSSIAEPEEVTEMKLEV